MSGVRVPAGPGVPGGLVVPERELRERFSHAGGPGGQGVNTADSRVQLTWDIASSEAVTEDQRARLLARLAPRLVCSTLTVDAAEFRSQARNRAAARERLARLVRDALAPEPRPRRPTKPTKGANERRLDAKRRRAQVKSGRRGAW